MSKSVVVGALGIAAVAVAGLWITQRAPVDVAISQAESVPPNVHEAAPTEVVRQEPGAQRDQIQTSTVAALTSPADVDEYSEDPVKMFKADEAGNLIVKERTRINLEKLSWLYTPDELQQKLSAIEQTLPPNAYRQLVDLMDRYKNFNLASKQAYSPDMTPSTVEQAIAQYEGLHALRVAHFGEESTNAMFGREERISRKLLEFMALEKHEGLTMEEKVLQAQEMLSRSPELAQLYDDNRNASNANN